MTYISDLRRSTSDHMIGGVCGGLAHNFQINSDLVRVGWVLLFLLAGTGGLLYLLLWWRTLPDDAMEYSLFP